MYGFSGTGANVALLISINWIILILMIMPDVDAANPYKLGQVDYFHNKIMVNSLKGQDQAMDWKEPVINTNGQVTYYMPPSPVLTLLENPTTDHARAYLAWQKLKVQKIIKAQEVIDQVIKEGETP